VGRAARVVTAVGTVGIVGAGVQVGHSGGMLVYRDGAASAYVNPTVRSTASRTSTDESPLGRVAERRVEPADER
jgi:hypothetical protein